MLKKFGMEYPPYYKPVYIEYTNRGGNISTVKKMWLAVNDDGKRIWTIDEDNTSIMLDKDIDIIDWWYDEYDEEI